MRYEQTVFNHMSQQQLAEYCGISTRTLERWQSIGWGPKLIKIGGRCFIGWKTSLSTRPSTSPTLPNPASITSPQQISSPPLPTRHVPPRRQRGQRNQPGNRSPQKFRKVCLFSKSRQNFSVTAGTWNIVWPTECRIAPGDAVEPSDRVRTPRGRIGRLP